MQQTFIKTVQGYTLEFNRLIFPVKYKITSRNFDPPGLPIIVDKDINGKWVISFLNELPGWVREITSDIYEIIKENESSKNVA